MPAVAPGASVRFARTSRRHGGRRQKVTPSAVISVLMNCNDEPTENNMDIEAVDFFYLSMPVVTDAGDGSQDALLVRVAALSVW